ncbi:MAG: malto-oligosyltrehalose synthase [Synergistales bacterium]|nr:malto-oligosyltrehalose synthase [Synergistales bacterium]
MRIPLSTYRFQLTPETPLEQLRQTIPYLAALGISDLYVSPLPAAIPGSEHGYDVTDPQAVNPELGDLEDLDRTAAVAREHHMGWVQDIVPNHMAFHPANRFLQDVLETGPSSRYAHWFDIRWEHHNPLLRGRLLAPFLGGDLQEVLRSGELQLRLEEGALVLGYYEHRFPLRIESYPPVLEPLIGGLGRTATLKEQQLLERLLRLADCSGSTPGAEQYREITATGKALLQQAVAHSVVNRAVEERLERLNSEPAELADLIDSQHYLPALWRVAAEAINYRRFFHINNLISLRMGDPRVFDATHRLPARLYKTGTFTGFRIDHIDGLKAPVAYLERLRNSAPEAYIAVEKILQRGETLPESWPIQGTTGYDTLTIANDILCDRAGEGQLREAYHSFTGDMRDPASLLSETKREALTTLLYGDLENLAVNVLDEAARRHQSHAVSRRAVLQVLEELVVRFPRYRTYLGEECGTSEEQELLGELFSSVEEALPQRRETCSLVREIMEQSYEGEPTGEPDSVVLQLQQLTGPVMAKGFEDSFLYRYTPLLSRNEVGGSPLHPPCSVETFHRFCARQQQERPHSMNATATHDTKRGEDARARLNVLTELAGAWSAGLPRWHRQLETAWRRHSEMPFPLDRREEHFLLQSLIGGLPFGGPDESFGERLAAYMVKALREAGERSSWQAPDRELEDAVASLVRLLLFDDMFGPFREDFLSFQRKVAFYGVFNSLAQTVAKITIPGVPDIYQGSELWDFSFVDPDNRRSVDYASRSSTLAELDDILERNDPTLLRGLLEAPEDGRIKMLVTMRTLQARQRYPSLFTHGSYAGIACRGACADSLIAFTRYTTTQRAVCIVPRLCSHLAAPGELPLGKRVWRDTTLEWPAQPGRAWRDLISGMTVNDSRKMAVGTVLQHLPCAVYVPIE